MLTRLVRVVAPVFVAIALLMPLTPALALDKVRVARTGVSIAWTILDGGQHAKIWESVGLELVPIQFAGDAAMQQALTAGALDIGLGSGPGMGYRVKGVPALSVAALAGPPYTFALLVNPGDAITSVDQLKGKSIGVTTAGSLTDWLVRELARQKGWGPDGIKSVPLGSNKARLVAMKSGDLDGMIVTSEVAHDYEDKGEGKLLATFGDIVTDFHTHVAFAHETFLKNRPDLVEAFLKGWFKSVAWMKANKEAGIKIAAKSLGISERAVAESYDDVMRMMSDDGAWNPKAVEVISRSLVEIGTLPTAPDPKSLYTDRFVPVKL